MFTQKLLETVRKHCMFSPGETVIVAVSGGADSVALLHALWTLKESLALSLHVAHLNHGIRGRQADRDAEFVASFADEFGLPLIVEKVDVPALKKAWRLSTEEAARKARYEFFDRTAEAVGAGRVATAHTLDDQAETVLLNLIRGAGPDGLSGIPPVRGKYVRPLLHISRLEVLEYCAAHDLKYRTDSTNLRIEYRRNRVRLELIPLLESHYNPRVKSVLASSAEILREESGLLSALASELFDEAAIQTGPLEVVLDIGHLLRAHAALGRRCARMAIERVKGDLRDLSFEQVERILRRLDAGGDFTLTLPSGVVYARREGAKLRVYRIEPEPEVPAVEVELPVPGRAASTELGVVITTELLSPPADYRRPLGSLDVVIDRDAVKGKLVLRNWRPGDRIRPLGMSEEKKLQDVFTDAKVPRRQRGFVPVVADREKIIWVAGMALSDAAKVTESTRQTLRLVCEGCRVVGL
ncbi:MAG: tRNA lysidine(34) synthetase TilS [Armatimonadota bacterium]|nr:tRNA lysidine(34) synthetase TilS [Armatimonadota bacterium]